MRKAIFVSIAFLILILLLDELEREANRARYAEVRAMSDEDMGERLEDLYDG